MAPHGDQGHSHGLLEHDHGVDVDDKRAGRSAPKEASLSVQARRQLLAAGFFCFLFMIGEVVGGYYAGSLAIMTDAAHLLSDLASFMISLYAIYLAERPPNAFATYGYHRFEVLGALASVMLIWLLTGVLVYEAINRVINPQPVDGKIMFITACECPLTTVTLATITRCLLVHQRISSTPFPCRLITASLRCGAAAGLGVNLVMMKILHQAPGGAHGHSHGGSHGHSHGGHGADDTNLNVRAAFIHVLGDLLQSVGVMIAAGVIWAYPDAHVADPICTFVFAVLVLFTTVGVLRQGVSTLLNSVPGHVSLGALAADLAALPGVANVHDLHVWVIGSGRFALSVHLVADRPSEAYRGALEVAQRYRIRHSTVAVEKCGSGDTEACYAFNDHMDDCAIEVESAAAAGEELALGSDSEDVEGGDSHHGHSHAGGKAHGHSHGDARPHSGPRMRLERPLPNATHADCDSGSSEAAPPAAKQHGHGHGGHGHSHGGHGHSHGHKHSAKVAEVHGHGHSHSHATHAGGHGDHGHSHA